MSSAHSMNARKCVHAQKRPVRHSSMNQAREEEEEKERQERQRPGGLWKERQQKKKNTSEELKQGLPRHSSG